MTQAELRAFQAGGFGGSVGYLISGRESYEKLCAGRANLPPVVMIRIRANLEVLRIM